MSNVGEGILEVSFSVVYYFNLILNHWIRDRVTVHLFSIKDLVNAEQRESFLLSRVLVFLLYWFPKNNGLRFLARPYLRPDSLPSFISTPLISEILMLLGSAPEDQRIDSSVSFPRANTKG